jgi:hypothetical protein
MRALPDLAPLAESPSVWAQPTDDWNGIFANEFASSAGEQGFLDNTTPGVFAGMDPISQAIDGLSSALDLAGSVLDILSGDLDLVNLDPIILDYQNQDNLLDSGLSGFTLDYSAIALGFFKNIWDVADELVKYALVGIWDVIQQIIGDIETIFIELNHVLLGV